MFCMTADKERPCTSFAVTSAKPSEGKSLTAANIAISYAMLGKKVLLIDADISNKEKQETVKVYRAFLEFSYSSTIILACGAIAAAPQLMNLLYTEKYLSGI